MTITYRPAQGLGLERALNQVLSSSGIRLKLWTDCSGRLHFTWWRVRLR